MLLGILLLVVNSYASPQVEQIARSGRCVSLAESPDARVAPLPLLAPGPAPVLSFRLYEGQLHHRYNNSDLMLDDAAH